MVATAALKRMWRNRNRNRQVPDSGNHHDASEQRTAAFCHG
jgi:predicted deacylase